MALQLNEPEPGFQITVGNETFQYPKSVLQKISYFSTLFANGMIETSTNQINFPELSSEVVQIAIKFAYSNNLPLDLDIPILDQLILLADQWQYSELLTKLEQKLQRKILLNPILTLIPYLPGWPAKFMEIIRKFIEQTPEFYLTGIQDYSGKHLRILCTTYPNCPYILCCLLNWAVCSRKRDNKMEQLLDLLNFDQIIRSREIIIRKICQSADKLYSAKLFDCLLNELQPLLLETPVSWDLSSIKSMSKALIIAQPSLILKRRYTDLDGPVYSLNELDLARFSLEYPINSRTYIQLSPAKLVLRQKIKDRDYKSFEYTIIYGPNEIEKQNGQIIDQVISQQLFARLNNFKGINTLEEFRRQAYRGLFYGGHINCSDGSPDVRQESNDDPIKINKILDRPVNMTILIGLLVNQSGQTLKLHKYIKRIYVHK